MRRPLTIIEIKRRSEQGVTRPFLCRADNDKWYWVKGVGAGKGALCREWIAGRIAQTFDLPIPDFAQVHVPAELIEYSAIDDVEELGTGIAFGSEHVEGAADLNCSEVDAVPLEVRRRTLAFDWWVQNQDRSLGEKGGNVNILRVAASGSVYIIDHNLAFDPDFDVSKLADTHVFRDELDEWDSAISLAFDPLLRDIMHRFDDFWAELPDEWSEAAEFLPEVSPLRLRAVLARLNTAGSLFGGAKQ